MDHASPKLRMHICLPSLSRFAFIMVTPCARHDGFTFRAGRIVGSTNYLSRRWNQRASSFQMPVLASHLERDRQLVVIRKLRHYLLGDGVRSLAPLGIGVVVSRKLSC